MHDFRTLHPSHSRSAEALLRADSLDEAEAAEDDDDEYERQLVVLRLPELDHGAVLEDGVGEHGPRAQPGERKEDHD